MDKQPKALRLADELEMWTKGEPAAEELRRLHTLNQELVEALKYHQEQTRPIQRTIDVLAKLKEQA